MPDFILSTGGKPWIENFRNEERARKAVTNRGYNLTSIEPATAEAKEQFERERADRGESPEPESPKPAFELGRAVVVSILWGTGITTVLFALICTGDQSGACASILLFAVIILAPIASLIVFCIKFIMRP